MAKSKEELKSMIKDLEEKVELYSRLLELKEELYKIEQKIESLKNPPVYVPTMWPTQYSPADPPIIYTITSGSTEYTKEYFLAE